MTGVQTCALPIYLEEDYLVLYIDATFAYTRRDESVKKEGYFKVLSIKEDGIREVLAIVNYPKKGALLWQQALDNIKKRCLIGVKLAISDGLTSIVNARARVFQGTKQQLCVVHFKRNVLAVFPRTKRAEIGAELKEVLQVETKKHNFICFVIKIDYYCLCI